ncbi:MAG: hypothetical protein ACYDCC_00880 [Actinomycetota bacterium]
MIRKILGLAIAVTVVSGMGSAFAVSDGNYHYQLMHCSSSANAFEKDNSFEPGCHNTTVTVSDLGGHEYFGIGSPQTKDHEPGITPVSDPFFGYGDSFHQTDYWYDLGQGCNRTLIDYSTQTSTPGPCPWMNPSAPNYYPRFNAAPNPASGIEIYFGNDDNIAGGEHDGTEAISNGPSDGGGAHVILDPRQLRRWVLAVAKDHPHYILTHPLPIGDAGIGFCADGICFSAQTQRQVAYQGSNPDAPSRDVATYGPDTWDQPAVTCNGGDAGASCPPGEGLAYWNSKNGTTYVEPGVQIYEDPDPQGSPALMYPLPGIYVGTCGVTFGGGMAAMPPSPFTNSGGQIQLATGC